MIDLKTVSIDQLHALANAAASQSDFEGAERALREAVARSPRDVETSNCRTCLGGWQRRKSR